MASEPLITGQRILVLLPAAQRRQGRRAWPVWRRKTMVQQQVARWSKCRYRDLRPVAVNAVTNWSMCSRAFRSCGIPIPGARHDGAHAADRQYPNMPVVARVASIYVGRR